MARLLGGIIINTGTIASTLTLPTGTAVYNSLLTFDKSIDFSVINTGTGTGTVTITETTGHTAVGNKLISTNASARFRTRLTALNIAITYRIS